MEQIKRQQTEEKGRHQQSGLKIARGWHVIRGYKLCAVSCTGNKGGYAIYVLDDCGNEDISHKMFLLLFFFYFSFAVG